jgi:hypothetical protein
MSILVLLTIILSPLAVIVGGILAYFWTKKHPEWGQPKKVEPTPPTGVKAQAGVVATVLAVGLALLAQVPSLSIDLSSIFSYASQIVSMLMPIVGVGAGISFGFSLVAYIMRLFRNIF